MTARLRGIVAATGLSLVAAFICFRHAEAMPIRHHRASHHWVYRSERPIAARIRGAGEDQAFLATAERFLGRRNPTGFRGPWCGAFLGMIAKIRGVDVPAGFRRAVAWLRAGTRVSRPRPGDLGVMPGHVTIFAGYRGRRFLGLGGNQRGGRVAISSFPVHRVIAWVRLK